MNKTLGLCLLSLVAGASMVSAARWREATVSPELGPLDKAMHDRFEVPENFGMGRIVMMPAHVTAPVFASAEARKAADELKNQGWDVNFYLGGRELFDPKVDVLAPPRVLLSEMRTQQAKMKGKPVFTRPQRALRGPVPAGIENKKAPNKLNPLEVAEISRQALRTLMDDKTKTEFRSHLGDWSLVAYPVKATKKSCAGCHSDSKPTPQVGDVLGVTVYAYRRA